MKQITLATTLAACLLLLACGKPSPAEEPIRSVRVMLAGQSNLAEKHDFAAEVRARQETRLAFRVGGKVVARRVEMGQSVRHGQILAQLDVRDLRLAQKAVDASLSAAKVNLDQSEAEFRRFKELRDQGFISAWELDRRESAVKSARAQAAQVAAQADAQENQTGYTGLTSDVNGIVIGLDLEVGMVVSAGTPVIRVAQDGPRDVVFAVPEDKVTRLRDIPARQGVLNVKFWGEGGREWPATVREIAPTADPVTRTFLVKADIGNAPVRLGQTATVSFAERSSAQVIKLPLAAVFEHQGKASVWLLDRDAMTVRAQAVTVAGADGNFAVIGQGLLPGQSVVTAGVHVLTPGQKVRLYVDPSKAVAR